MVWDVDVLCLSFRMSGLKKKFCELRFGDFGCRVFGFWGIDIY